MNDRTARALRSLAARQERDDAAHRVEPRRSGRVTVAPGAVARGAVSPALAAALADPITGSEYRDDAGACRACRLRDATPAAPDRLCSECAAADDFPADFDPRAWRYDDGCPADSTDHDAHRPTPED